MELFIEREREKRKALSLFGETEVQSLNRIGHSVLSLQRRLINENSLSPDLKTKTRNGLLVALTGNSLDGQE